MVVSYVGGHSSGGDLAGIMLTTDWSAYDLPANVVKGGVVMSGMFDLEPVRLSWRKAYLNFADEMVDAMSPQRHLDRVTAPVVVSYGTLETPEFVRQSKDFAAALKNAGKPVELVVGNNYFHQDIGPP